MEHINVRLTNEQLAAIQELAATNGLNFSEQLRAAIDKYLQLAKQINEGNLLISIPGTRNDGHFYSLMHEIEALVEENPTLDIQDYLVPLKSGLQFDFAMKKIEKDPESLILLSGFRDYLREGEI